MSEIAQLAEVLDETFPKRDMVTSKQLANDVIVDMWKRGFQFTRRPPKIQTSVWTHKEGTPYMERARRKTVWEVYNELTAIVGKTGPGHDEYLSMPLTLPEDAEWPEGRIVCFSVDGTSEGDYTHVEVHNGDGERTLIFLGKTFDGRDASWAFARQLADIFEELV